MIARTVKPGTETALAWLQETLAIEAQGAWLYDGSRRARRAGVFF